MSKKVAIVGSRSFDDYEALCRFVGECVSETPSLVVSGGAQGADTLGERFANERTIPFIPFIPDWNSYGKRAGFVRNEQIVTAADIVIAFWDGQSRGTANSIEIARKLGKQLFIFYYKPKPKLPDTEPTLEDLFGE